MLDLEVASTIIKFKISNFKIIQCLVIEDALAGVQAAKAAQMRYMHVV